jgi:nucleoside-diphosphate-sugar epimerase
MRVLVTGATGFVGSHAAARLHASGHTVRLLVRDRRPAERVLGAVRLRDAELAVGDAADVDFVRDALRDCDGVVHTAAATPLGLRGGQDLDGAQVDMLTSVVGGACAAGVASVVYVSSLAAIFHPIARTMTRRAPIARARLGSGRGRARAERYVRSLQQRGAPVMTLYPGGVLGPDDPGLAVASAALRDAVRDRLCITSTGAQQIDVRDLAEATTRLVEEACGPGRYLAPGPYLSWLELADLIEKLVGRRLLRQHVPGWRLRARGRALDWLRVLRRVDSPISAESMVHTTRWPRVETSPDLIAMGVVYRAPEETIRDTLLWLCDAGHLDPALVPGLRGVA